MGANDETELADLLGRLRNPDLPRGMRGLQEDAARRLLTESAVALEELARECDELREVAETRARETEGEGGPADAEAVGRALVAATSVGDGLRASAEADASRIVAAGRVEAERIVEAARAEAAEIRAEAEHEGAAIAARSNAFLDLARAALARLDELSAPGAQPGRGTVAPPELPSGGNGSEPPAGPEQVSAD